MKVLLLLIALVLAYLVGQIHLVHMLKTYFPAAWLVLQIERDGYKLKKVKEEDVAED